MFFICFLKTPKRHVVVPITWIENIDMHWEKFINESINRNQKFKVFYSQEPNAVDDFNRPDPSFEPNYQLQMDPEFPETACYTANLVGYRGK